MAEKQTEIDQANEILAPYKLEAVMSYEDNVTMVAIGSPGLYHMYFESPVEAAYRHIGSLRDKTNPD